MDLRYSSDNLGVRGFIDKEEILRYVSEQEIFALVFGFIPEEYQYVTSPLREDNNAGCWFETTEHGFVFRDFAHGTRPLDCFNVVQMYYKLDSFYATLKFIYDRLIEGKDLTQRRQLVKTIVKKDTIINFSSRKFINQDRLFWTDYGISKQNLIDDKVFPVSSVMIDKEGEISAFKVKTICYAYTDFKSGRKKLYFPKKKNRFVTNCTKNDIGNVSNLIPHGRQLIITKSYKDCRVLVNQGKNVIWIHNEGMIPSADSIMPIIRRFDKVYVFYDNDATGIQASSKFSAHINTYFPKRSSSIYLPVSLNQQGISDPADFIKEKGRVELNNYLNTYLK